MNDNGDYWSNSGESEYDPSKWYGADEPEEYNEEEIEEFYGRSSYYDEEGDEEDDDEIDEFDDVDSVLDDEYGCVHDEGDNIFDDDFDQHWDNDEQRGVY